MTTKPKKSRAIPQHLRKNRQPTTAKNPKGAGPPANEKAKARFLELYQEYGQIKKAAEQVPISSRSVYLWIAKDPEYAALVDAIKPIAKQTYVDILEEEAHRRAVEGIDEPVYYKGELVTTVKKYSDLVLLALLRANAPEKYRERTDLNVAGKDGGPIEIIVRWDGNRSSTGSTPETAAPAAG